MFGLNVLRIKARRHRLDALALTVQQQAETIGPKRGLTVGMTQSCGKFIQILIQSLLSSALTMFNTVLNHAPYIPRLREISKKPLARRGRKDSSRHHDWRRLSDSGGTLTELARDGLAEHRLARRANALVLLDRGMSCEDVGRVLLIDDDTIRTWHRLFEADGVDGLAGFKYRGRACQLTLEQQVTLKAWVGDTLPRTTRSVDRTRVRGCLREPFRADCAGASSGTGTSQARGDVAQARPGQTESLHRRLRGAAEDAARRRGGDVRRRGASMGRGRWAAGRPKRSRSRSTRPGSPEHSRRPRSGNRQDPHDRGGDGQRPEHDRPAGRDRVSGEADHPCVSG